MFFRVVLKRATSYRFLFPTEDLFTAAFSSVPREKYFANTHIVNVESYLTTSHINCTLRALERERFLPSLVCAARGLLFHLRHNF